MLRKWFAALLLLAAPLVGLEVTGTIPVTGLNTVGIALAPNNNLGYVSNNSAARVYQFNRTTLTVTNAISLGGLVPAGIAITPDGSYAYVVNTSASGVVSRINLSDLSVESIPIPALSALFIAIAPDEHYAYVPTVDGNSVVRINLTDGMFTADSLAVAGRPIGIAVTPDSAFAYVACQTSSTITKIDLTSFTIAIDGILATTAKPYNLAITPDGASAYVVSFFAPGFVDGSPRITKIDLGTFMISDPPLAFTSDDNTSHYIAITPDGAFAYVTSFGGIEGGILTEIDLDTFSVSEALTLGGTARGVAVTSGGSTIYVAGLAKVFQVASFLDMPRNLTGVQKKNNAGLEYNLVNELRWLSGIEAAETGYNVYRNGVKIASLMGDVFSYNDNGVQKGVVNEYQVTAVSDNDESPPATVLVP